LTPTSLRPPVWDWSFAEDGALALAPEPDRELNRRRESGTVRQMSAPAPGRAARSRHIRQHPDARRRRFAVVVAIALVAVGTLLVTAFGGGDHPTAAQPAPASASRLLPAGPPALQVIAQIGALHLALPINQSRVTAIGYHGASDGALGLTPIGTQANAGLLKRLLHKIVGGGSGSPRWYLLPGGQGPSTSALDIGAAPGTDVYAPVSGTIVGIGKLILDGKTYGERIDIQPTSAPSLVVSVSRLTADPSLVVGAIVTWDGSRLGQVRDLSNVERQALARYTNDSGNHVLVEVHPAATLDVR
jgi:hypothetical protein